MSPRILHACRTVAGTSGPRSGSPDDEPRSGSPGDVLSHRPAAAGGAGLHLAHVPARAETTPEVRSRAVA